MHSGFFEAADGLQLYAEHHPPDGAPRGGALVVHGYADHCGRYAEVCRELAAAGFYALAFDYRGHGRAGGPRGHCDRFDEYLGDLDRAHALLRAEVGDRPTVLVAHSHGGLIGLRALTDPARPVRFSAAVLSSPFLGIAMKVNPVKVVLGRVMSRVYPTLAMPNGIVIEHLTHDAAILEATRKDALRHGVATARWFTEMVAAQEFVHEHAGRLPLPTLWLVAGGDRVVDAQATRQVYDRAGGDKHLEWYDGFYHEVFNEVGRERVFARLKDWLSARVSAT